MKQQAIRIRQSCQNQYRSTSDLLPKCRADALRDKRAAARNKINLIARQLYELKYDHEWQQQQLQRLVAKGEDILGQVDEKMRKAKEEVEVLVGQRDMEGLVLDKVEEKQGNALASQRSTQPERDDQSKPQKAQRLQCQMEQTVTVIHTSKPMTHSLKIQKPMDERMFGSVRVNNSPMLKPTSTRKMTTQQLINDIPIGNILLFVCLLAIVLTLL